MILFSEAKFLQGKIAVISGANRGIGKAICETFLAHGAQVIACVRNPRDMREQWQDTPAVANEQLHCVALDLADEGSVKAASRSIRDISRKIDILINNAGIATGGLFQMTSIAEMKALFEVNLFHQVMLSQNLVKSMVRQQRGVIVNISSSAAQAVDSGTLSYGSAKAAFERVTQSMALELAASGIRVNAIAPGVTETDMGRQMDAAAQAQLLEKCMLKRMATPQDIANTALFLCSDLASHITGQIVHVNGGR